MSSQNGKIDSLREENFESFCHYAYKLYLKNCVEENLMVLDFDEWFNIKFDSLNTSFELLIVNGD